MERLKIRRADEVRKQKQKLEKALNVQLTFKNEVVSFDGNSLDEFDALRVFESYNFGFSLDKALLLKSENFMFKRIHIKEHTKRNLRDVKARLIGKYGKTRKVISEISGCYVVIRGGEVGVIGDAEIVGEAEEAIIHLIKGAKQSNIYKHLEKLNTERKRYGFHQE